MNPPFASQNTRNLRPIAMCSVHHCVPGRGDPPSRAPCRQTSASLLEPCVTVVSRHKGPRSTATLHTRRCPCVPHRRTRSLFYARGEKDGAGQEDRPAVRSQRPQQGMLNSLGFRSCQDRSWLSTNHRCEMSPFRRCDCPVVMLRSRHRQSPPQRPWLTDDPGARPSSFPAAGSSRL